MRKLSLAITFIAAVWLGCAETRGAETSAPPAGAAAESADKKISLAPAAASSYCGSDIFSPSARIPSRISLHAS